MFSSLLLDSVLSCRLGSHEPLALQEPRGVDSSRTSTTSLTAKFIFTLVHFCLSCRDGRYSRNQRRQNTSARYYTWCHLRREKLLSLTNAPGGNVGPECKSSRWLGVKASGSLGLQHDWREVRRGKLCPQANLPSSAVPRMPASSCSGSIHSELGVGRLSLEQSNTFLL